MKFSIDYEEFCKEFAKRINEIVPDPTELELPTGDTLDPTSIELLDPTELDKKISESLDPTSIELLDPTELEIFS